MWDRKVWISLFKCTEKNIKLEEYGLNKSDKVSRLFNKVGEVTVMASENNGYDWGKFTFSLGIDFREAS